jgi:hypothetical protein
MKFPTTVLAAGLQFAISLAAAQSAHAQDNPYISPTVERVRISLGVIQTSSATKLRIDSTSGVPGTDIDVENDLAMDEKKIGPNATGYGSTISRSTARHSKTSKSRSAFATKT